jgi:hypothetical protein
MESYIPLIREKHYPAFRQLAPGHPDFPPSYQDWLRWRVQHRADEQSHGHTVVDVKIKPAEFWE